VTAPALFADPGAFWQNIVAFPLGLSKRPTQAASPLPGHLLASTGSLGHLAAVLLLGAAALGLCISLVVRPPRDIRQASVRLVIGLAAMFLLAPAARFGYVTYPVGILCWLILLDTTPYRLQALRAERSEAQARRRRDPPAPPSSSGSARRREVWTAT
jgi:hypothetical protein